MEQQGQAAFDDAAAGDGGPGIPEIRKLLAALEIPGLKEAVAKDVATWKKLLEQNADVKAVADSLVTKAMDVLGENCKYLEGNEVLTQAVFDLMEAVKPFTKYLLKELNERNLAGRTASADDTHLHQPIDVTNIKTSADAYSVLLQRLEDWETAGRAARAAQHEQLHILSLQVKVLQAAQPVLAALQQRLPAAEPASDGRKGRAGVQQAQLATTAAALQRANEAHAALVAATAAAGAALESGARLQQQVAATAAAIAPAAGGLSGLDAAQLLCYFTAGVSAASITLHHKQALDTDLKGIYKDTSSMRPTPAAHAWSDSELKVSSSSRTRFSGQYSSSITAQQQVGHATGTTQWSQDPVMNCPYDIEWLARRENGNSYLDVKATVHATGNSKAQKTTAMAVSKMLLLVGDAAGVAAVSQGQLEHSSWGGWGAIFTPSPEAVRDGRIVGAATGITEAVAGGVDMLVPATAAD